MHCARLPEAAALLQQLRLPVSALTADSRRAWPGVAFAAYPGAPHDGRAMMKKMMQQSERKEKEKKIDTEKTD